MIQGSALGLLAACAMALTAMATAAVAGRPPLLDFSPTELRLIEQHGPWPLPEARDAGNAQAGNPQAIALGQKLFFDRRLSPGGQLSCASCHAPARAFADGRVRSLGRGGEVLDRNAPSLWNGVHERWYGWDGAADSLWSQAIRPLLDTREMASSAEHIAATIGGDKELGCRYRQVFGRDAQVNPQATLVDAAKAIGAFTGTLVSGRTTFDLFRDALARKDTRTASNYPLAAQRGLRLFVGRARCNVCHIGPLFTNGEFGDIGLPFFIRPGMVDPGRHAGIAALRASHYNLMSSWSDAPANDAASTKTRHVNAQHRNFGEFKVPSLRNAAQTTPYMHDGQLATLPEVVRHYSELNLERLHADGEQILAPLRLSEQESSDLLAFLKTLSDPHARAWKARPMSRCLDAKP